MWAWAQEYEVGVGVGVGAGAGAGADVGAGAGMGMLLTVRPSVEQVLPVLDDWHAFKITPRSSPPLWSSPLDPFDIR